MTPAAGTILWAAIAPPTRWPRNSASALTLSLRDLPFNVNFFSKVVVTEDGALHFTPSHSKPGSSVDLRAEMNSLVIIDANQHPLDPATTYAPKPIRLSMSRTGTAGPDDLCRHSCPENERGYINTERYFL